MQDFCVKFESNVVFPQFHTTGQDFFLFSTTPFFMLSVTDFPTHMHYMHPPKLNITQFWSGFHCTKEHALTFWQM